MTNDKGALRHKASGKTIEGVELVFRSTNGRQLDVRLADQATRNTFYTSEWEFIPDTKPLPREAIISAPGFLPLLIISGTPYQTIFGLDRLELLKKDEEHVFTRLRKSGATIMVDQKIEDKEVYL